MRRGVLVALAVLAALGLALAGAALIEVARVDVAGLESRVPRRTALMIEREREAAREGRALEIDQRWVPYDRISPLLRRAVLVAEDDAFYSHDGLDWNEIRASARRNLEARRVVRGGSTITQQLARNLFLGDERSLTRKLKEVFLAIRLERALSKRRIFELYLNEIEWGDAIFGVEAAAQHYFGGPAESLDARQSLLLAAIIINPRHYSPLRPEGRIERRVRLIAGRLHRRGALDDQQYRIAIGEAPASVPVLGWLRRLFGGGPEEPTETPPAEAPSNPTAPGDTLAPADTASAGPD